MEFAKCILFSLNYSEIDSFNRQNNKDGIYSLLLDASLKLIEAGADCIVLCANTLHQFVDRLEKEINIPIIHIAEATAAEIKRNNIKKIGLLGTKQTMEMDFYKKKLNEKNIEVLIPGPEDRDFIQNTINNELIRSIFSDESRSRFIEICKDLSGKGAEGIVLGCTEIPLLLKQVDISIPLFNTLLIHSVASIDFVLEK